MDYLKPALVEIYAEFFLSKEAIPAEKLFDYGIAVKEIGLPVIDLAQNIELDLTARQAQPVMAVPKLRCWNQERNQLVQIAPGLVAVNLVSSTTRYPGWEEFRAFIDKALSVTVHATANPGLKSISLNTIDKFRFSISDFALDKFFDVGGNIIPGWYRGSKEACDLDFGWGLLERDGFNRQLHIKVRPEVEQVEVFVTSNFHQKCEEIENIPQTLEDLHVQSRASFEALVSEHCRIEVMGGLV